MVDYDECEEYIKDIKALVLSRWNNHYIMIVYNRNVVYVSSQLTIGIDCFRYNLLQHDESQVH